MAIACCFRLRSKSDKHIVHFEIVVTYNMLTFMANYVGKAGDLRYNDQSAERTEIRKYKSSYLCPLLYHIANRLLNQFVNFLNMEIQMI